MLQQTRKRRPTSRFEKMVSQTFRFDVGGLVDWLYDGATWPHPSRLEPPDLAVYVLSQAHDVFLDPEDGDDPIPRHVVAAIEILELSTKLASAAIPAALHKLRRAHVATEDALVTLSALRDQLDRMSSLKGFTADNKKLLEELGRLTEAFDSIPALAERLETQYGGQAGRGRKRRDELVELERRLFVRGYTSAEIAAVVDDDLGRAKAKDNEADSLQRKNRVGWRRRQRARGYQ